VLCKDVAQHAGKKNGVVAPFKPSGLNSLRYPDPIQAKTKYIETLINLRLLINPAAR
jgi:hypothetical protein